MGPYSHYILAARLAPELQPENPAAYYWGAVAPDIRYLANLRREHTHLALERVKELQARYPHLKSFLTGYQVHLLIDQIEIAPIVEAAFPLSLLNKVRRKPVPPEQMTMLVEMYYLLSESGGEPLAGGHNPVFADLGITAEQTRAFHQGLQEYFDARTFEAAIATFAKIGMIQNTRLEKYRNAFRKMQKRSALNLLLMLSIRNARLDTQVIRHVRAGMGG